VSLDGGDNCDGLDNGFRITKIKWTNEESSNTTTSESYSCCNGNDGVGQKVFSRIEAVQKAMKTVVEDTSDNITWGLLQWSGDGISGEASLGSTVSTLHSEIDNLYPNGGTPMGEGMQEAYDYSYNYLNNHTDVSECSKNYLIVLTDGFPSGDNSWSRISEDDNDPDFSSSSYHDSDSWGGDPTQGEGDVPNYSDDVARWMYNSTEADFKFTSHTIGFGLENPLLVDIANESNGIHLTAYDQTQLTNAFYSLGLAISEGVSFTAPAISVDEANRAQTGDEIYMSFFKPVSDDYWLGNVKKYRLGWNATGEQILDKNNATATDEDGVFKDTSTSLWSTTNDGGNVAQGGAGQLIKDNVDTYFTSGYSYYRRNIKTWKNNQMVDFSPASVNASELNVSNSSEVSKIVNLIHGYTHAAADNGDPLAVRDWPLGDIIHSEPVIIDYIDNSTSRVLTDRFLAVGSNDGMLHIFDTETGEEKLSFIPPDILDQLQYISNPDEHNYGVDGQLSVYQKGRNPDLLILGERRGGSKYWALNCTDNNPDNWTVAWSIGPTGVFSELGQSWSKMTFSNLTNSSGSNLNRDVGIFTAGYDESEDNFNGTLPSSDTKGRGFFVVDMGTGNSLFRAVHGSVNATTTINGTVTITRSDMKYCFPGSPAVLNLPESHPDGDLVVYASDIAGQIWKFLYTSETSMLDKWSVKKIFCSNGPNMMGGAQTSSGSVDKLDGFRDYNQNDKGRKCFNQPEVSYAGDCTTDYPVIYFGTGDRTHPKIDSVKNRFYAFYDMSHNASMIPLDETDLLNLTCDEFDENSPLTGTQQAALKQKLGENYSSQAQGWYINLAEQGNCTYFDSINPDDLNHAGEKVLNPAVLFYKKVYFNTYIPTLNDPCNPKGKSLFYALDYCYGTSGYNYDETNLARTVSDRYFTVEDSTPPSPTRIITRPSKGAIKASSGSRLINEEIDVPEGLQILWWKYNE
jgi:type IV pilus assembly protein PilY1